MCKLELISACAVKFWIFLPRGLASCRADAEEIDIERPITGGFSISSRRQLRRFARRALRARVTPTPEPSRCEVVAVLQARALQIWRFVRARSSRSPRFGGRPHPLQLSQSSLASQRRCQRRGLRQCQRSKRPLNPADDAASSTFVHTLGGLRTASGSCPMCDEPVGARTDMPSACKRRVLDNATSSCLGLKLRDLCQFPCLGWCCKKPKPGCTSRPRPHATCDNCYWACSACYMKHYRAFQKPDTADQTASTSASAVETESRGHTYCRLRCLLPSQEAGRCARHDRCRHRLGQKAVPSR
jgi:hypothetical protein